MRPSLITGKNADEVWRLALLKLHRSGETQSSRIGVTREIRHVMMEIRDSIDRVVFSRAMNPAYAIAEIIWIFTGSNDSSFLKFWNPRMSNYLDQGKSHFYGAYGSRLGSKPLLSEYARNRLRIRDNQHDIEIDQLRSAVSALKEDSHSRQVVLQIWNKELDLPNPLPRSLDVPCNLLSHLLVRNGRLEWLQVMRSTDLAWGLPYNFMQFTTIQEIIAGWLNLEVGPYIHISDSLHLYKRHWRFIHKWINSETKLDIGKPKSLAIYDLDEWYLMFQKLVDLVLKFTEVKDKDKIYRIVEEKSQFSEGYAQWLVLLGSDALRRRGFPEEAKKLIWESGNYWATSWLKWVETKDSTLEKSR